jgi:hypothetical protein
MDKNNVITKYTLKITQNFSTLSVIRCLYGLDSKFIFNVNRFKLFVADHGIVNYPSIFVILNASLIDNSD